MYIYFLSKFAGYCIWELTRILAQKKSWKSFSYNRLANYIVFETEIASSWVLMPSSLLVPDVFEWWFSKYLWSMGLPIKIIMYHFSCFFVSTLVLDICSKQRKQSFCWIMWSFFVSYDHFSLELVKFRSVVGHLETSSLVRILSHCRTWLL